MGLVGGVTWEALTGQPPAGLMAHHGVLAKNGILYLTYLTRLAPTTAKRATSGSMTRREQPGRCQSGALNRHPQ